MQFNPVHWADVQTEARVIKKMLTTPHPVIRHYVETAAKSEKEFLERFMSMPRVGSSARHIIKEEHPLYFKLDFFAAFDDNQASPAI